MRTKSFSIFQAPLPRQMKLPDLPAILQPPRTTRTPRHVLWGQRQQKSSNTEHRCPAFIAKANTEICDQVFQRAQQLEGFVECLSVNTTVGTAGCSSGNLARLKKLAMSLPENAVLYDPRRNREANSTKSKGAAATDRRSFLPLQTRFQISPNPPKIKVPGHWKPKR